MTESLKAARRTFEQLAVFELDPRGFVSVQNAANSKVLLRAVDLVDDIFWRQTSPGIDHRLLLDQIDDDEKLKEMFLSHRGPYDRLNDDAPFLPVEAKVAGAGFYPADMSQAEFLRYMREYPESKPSLESPFTVVRRVDSRLTAIPYHEAYSRLVETLSDLLTEASASEPHSLFRAFLEQRSQDVLTDKYYESDRLWVQLSDNPVDLVLGPYERYEDRLMGLKASYEAMVLERDLEETRKVQQLQHDLVSLCKSLEPMLGKQLHVEDARIRISVSDLVYAGGEARKTIPAVAFTLPNDERVIEEVGARQVLLKNVLAAKFSLVAWEILNRQIDTSTEDEETSFRNFFDHTLFHEVAHSIGPQRIMVNEEATTVNRSLKQHHSTLEEAKADVLGACLMLNADSSPNSHGFLQTFVSGILRSIRFGPNQPHGRANIIQLNYLFRDGALNLEVDTGKLSIDQSRARTSLLGLGARILEIQERGDISAAQQFVDTFCVTSSEIERLLLAMSDIPIDIRIRYTT